MVVRGSAPTSNKRGVEGAAPYGGTGTRGRGHKPLPYGDGDARAIRESPLRGDAGLHRRGGYHPPVCRAQAQVRGRLIAAPTKKRETGKLALPRLLNHNAKNQTNEFRIPVS